MPKSNAKRRLDAKGKVTQRSRPSQSVEASVSLKNANVGGKSSGSGLRVRGKKQDLLMAGCIALGCWGFAVSFAFTTTDPNRYTYGALAAMLALMWSVLFAMRLRKWLQQG
jgi:hypothetical protein